VTPKLSRTYAVVVVVPLFLAGCERTAPTEPAPGAEHDTVAKIQRTIAGLLLVHFICLLELSKNCSILTIMQDA
jgi:hypothetical protein